MARASRIAAAFQGGRWLKGYVRGKLLADPVFDTALGAIREQGGGVLDLGCGLGLLGLWLKAHDHAEPYAGCDLGSWKITEGMYASKALGYSGMELHDADLTTFPLEFPLGRSGTICAFDILHYLPSEIQERLVRRLASAARGGSLILVRNGVRGCGWRSSVTLLEEWWTRASGWIREGEINFPQIDRLVALFEEEGCLVQAEPLWGKTPFSSYWLKVSSPR